MDDPGLVAICRALGDPARLAIMRFLLDPGGRCRAVPGRVCASDIVTALGLAQPTVSHHMAVLVQAGLVAASKAGRWMHYSPVPERFAAAAAVLAALGRRAAVRAA